MRIAFTAMGIYWDSIMDSRFGRAELIIIYDEEKNVFEHYDNKHIKNEIRGAGSKTAQKLIELNPDVLLTGNDPGGNAVSIINHADIKVFIGAGDMTVKEAYEKYIHGDLLKYQ